jgi:hypothetical protein
LEEGYSLANGMIALMGTGEFSGTMVEVHKSLLKRHGKAVEAVFLDTPAGFQLNVDDLGRKAVSYFDRHIQQFLTVVSLKNIKQADPFELSKAYDMLSRADYILMGPGSPTYALDQWQGSRMPEIFHRHIEKGGTLVASSAAALTLGTKSLPVYEIYKVGWPSHWVKGLQLLDGFGYRWAVMPHWNNTEGGTHDTRFCFMGQGRLQDLLLQLPEAVNILGLDEHTALEINLDDNTARVKGIGRVTLLGREGQCVFEKGDAIDLARLRDAGPDLKQPSQVSTSRPPESPGDATPGAEDDFWRMVHELEAGIKNDLEHQRIEHATRSLLALEGLISQSHALLMEKEALGAVRDVFRELLAELGTRLAPRQGE